MAWNQPGNNGQDRDPWGSSSNNGGNSGGNKNGRRNQRPTDLDDIFRKLSGKFGKFGGNLTGGSGINGRMVSLIAVVLVVIWAVSGFYTIKETDQGVVTRFGKFSHLVQPGLNWKPTFIDHVEPVNVKTTRELATSGVMLTADENVVRVEMNVQYQVTNPQQYLFNVTNADDSLRQATDSALRAVIGKYSMDKILTEGRTVVRSDTYNVLIDTIKLYNMGITVQDVNFQAARPPQEVQAAFDDAIAARENEQQYIRQAEAYANEVLPKASGQAQRLLENAKAYRARTILEAQGEVAWFKSVLPQYKLAPEVTRERMYLDMMEQVLSHSRKVLVDSSNNNVLVLPLEQLLQNQKTAVEAGKTSATPEPTPVKQPVSATSPASNGQRAAPLSIMEQRRLDAERNDTLRIGRE
ncbi:MAG: FtsH protease activity modulator HflK [Enterobacteriaceae bacterium]